MLSSHLRYIFVVFSVRHSLGQSVTDIALFIFWLISQIAFPRKSNKMQNTYLLDLFTFVVFSVCHSLGQSVTVISLSIYWPIFSNIAKVRKFTLWLIVYIRENFITYRFITFLLPFFSFLQFLEKRIVIVIYCRLSARLLSV